MRSPLELLVTLDAQIGYSRERNQMPVSRPVRPVAAQTIQTAVLIPRIREFRAHRVRGVLQPVMTRPAELDDGRRLHQVLAIGGVHEMAG